MSTLIRSVESIGTRAENYRGGVSVNKEETIALWEACQRAKNDALANNIDATEAQAIAASNGMSGAALLGSRNLQTSQRLEPVSSSAGETRGPGETRKPDETISGNLKELGYG